MTIRWTARIKRQMILDAQSRPDDVEAMLRKHDVTREEFDRWCDLYATMGINGLKSTFVQNYRDLHKRRIELRFVKK